MTYREAVAYLESRIDHEKAADYDYAASFKLERMRGLAGLCGDPHLRVPAAHIAGSKGKGSTAAFLYSILRESGLRPGLYTSPHLVSVRERICGSGGKTHSFWAMNSLRISFCRVPVSLSGVTPCFSPTAMYMARTIAAGALMVIEVEILPRSIPSKMISMSFKESTATPHLPTSPREKS